VGPVVANMSVSLDGFVADQDDVVEAVFSWVSKLQPQRSTDGDGTGERARLL